jgi:hypothetical protein
VSAYRPHTTAPIHRALHTLLAAALTASACSGEIVRLELPDTTGSRALLVAVDHQNELRITALNIDPLTKPELLPVLDPLAETASFAVALYANTLEELGLTEGPIPRNTDEPDRMLPLPTAARYHQLEVLDGRAVRWNQIPSAPALIGEFRYRSPQELCRRFDGQTVELDFVPRVMLPDPQGAIVIEGRTNGLQRVTPAGVEPLGAVPTTVLPVVVSAWRAPNGEFFFGSHDGIVARGQLGAFEPMPPIPSLKSIVKLVGPSEPSAPFELYALQLEGSLWRYQNESGWTRLSDGIAEESFGDNAVLLWLSPGHAFTVPAQMDRIDALYFEYTGGDRARSFMLPFGLFGSIGAATVYRDRPFAVTELSKVIRFDENGGNEELAGAVEVSNARGMMRYEDGFVYAGSGASFVQYSPRLGYCQPVTIPSRIAPGDAYPFEDGLVVVGRLTPEVLFLRRLPPLD